MKKILAEIVIWMMYVIFGALLAFVVYTYLDRPVSMSIIIGVGGFLLLVVGNEALDRRMKPKKEVPTPEQFLETNDAKGERAIIREYILVGGDGETMRTFLRSRR